ncbi:YqiA/YcfP family alpha/beta fold hydrolase [Caenimonas sp. SL110]|uniref:YqiA/YcfP family alpha/beta fold hydrolase n=1 Tax=Caenimonas sp. SL110 TaxID=1450524 RepID=UPI000652A2EB|nr:YqiA/YcfP family alpha/beta fold hydrolase [Caenimonas sp. SL110]
MNTTHLLYLHGFRSSPLSTKARMVASRMHEANPHVTWWCPQLPPSPAAAMQLLRDGVANWPRESMAVMGSSLGGFYATCVAAQMNCHAVVLNPAVHPARDLAAHVGDQTSWHDPNEHFVFEPRYVDELRELELSGSPDPSKVLAVIAKGDELLDWREMTARYPGSRIRLLEGSDHAISDFADHIDEVFGFLGLR